MREVVKQWGAPALVVLAAIVANAGHVVAPLVGDDAYVLPNLLSSDPLRFLFAFHYDAPSDDFTPWYSGVVYQRRFLRLPACALLMVEARLFGRSPFGYHAVTLLLVIATLLVLYRLLHEWLGDRVAAAVALLPIACHPAIGEIVANVNCQPLAFAGLFMALAAQQWIRWRRTHARGALAGAVGATFVAMTSYEAAVVTPVLIVLGDLWFARDAGWRSRLAMLALLVVYVPAAAAARFDLVHPETQPVRPLADLLETLRIDTGNYVLKTFGVFDGTAPMRYTVYNAIGELPALAIAVGCLAIAAVAARRQRWAWLGVLAFAALLAPPLLTRAAVSRLNIPTLRQLYLPLVFGLSLVCAAIAVTPRSRRLRLCLLAAFAVGLGVQNFMVTRVPVRLARAHLSATVRSLLAGHDDTQPIIAIGRTPCAYGLHQDTAAPIVRPFPTTAKGELPELHVIDDVTIEASAPGGFDIAVAHPLPVPQPDQDARYSGGGFRLERTYPFDPDGVARIPGATIRIAERTPTAITKLRATLDVPLSQSTVLLLEGCKRARLLPPR